MGNISTELNILKAFCDDRSVYNAFGMYMHSLKTLERELKLILRLIGDYYEEFKLDNIQQKELVIYYDVLYPVNRDKEIIHDIIGAVFACELNEDLVTKLLEMVMEKHYASRVIGELMGTVEGTKSGNLVQVYQDIGDYVSKLKNPPKELNKLVQCDLSLEEIVKTEIEYEGLHWHLQSIDEHVGKLKRKTLGMIYAFVDSGKTSFIVAGVCEFARQLQGTDQSIVYAGNEEAGTTLNLRISQALLGITKEQLMVDIGSASRLRDEKGFGRIKIYDSVTSIAQVVELLDEHRPRVFILDQAVNVQSAAKEEGVKELKILFRAYRELAKEYNTSIVGVVQGTGDCESKKYLDLSDIYGSRVPIQGALDYAIGIGKVVNDAAYESHRWINIPKNKLGTGEKPRFVTMFDHRTCGWEEV